MDTKDELQRYEVMAKVKRKSITVQVERRQYYEFELEDVTEEEALEQAIMLADEEPPYAEDVEVVDHWINRL